MSEPLTPPHNLEAEESLLGAMLLSEQAVSSSIGIVSPDDFYRPAHKKLCEVVFDLYESESRGIDPVTVANALRSRGWLDDVGGSAALISLQVGTPTIGNARDYAEIVRDCSVRRGLIQFSSEVQETGYDPGFDTASTLKDAEDKLYALSSRLIKVEEAPTGTLASRALDEIAEGWMGHGDQGVSTGLKALDKFTGGLIPSRFYLLGARPAMGKSALAANIASSVAMTTNLPVLFFSIEMGAEEVAHRINLSHSLISSGDVKNGYLSHGDWARMKATQSTLNRSGLVIDDSSSLSIMDVYSKVKRAKAVFGGLGLVVIDYLQLMASPPGKHESRQLEISQTSRRLKLMARELDTPVLALSQLSRQLELRADKRPLLSDLRESGSLEQDADCVMFIYRDEVYNPDSEDGGFAEIIVAKNRQGDIGTAKVAWMAPMLRFANVSSAM